MRALSWTRDRDLCRTRGRPQTLAVPSMLERRRTRVRALTQVWVVCREFTAPNFTHIGALRATACGGASANFCAVGSGDDLGTSTATTTIREVAPGFFECGTCGGGAGGGSAGGGAAGGTSGGGGSFTCVEHPGFNDEHVVALRAQSCPMAAAACAIGSGDNLGLFSNRTTLREIRPGSYELGSCPGGAGGGSAGGERAVGGGVAGGSAAGGNAAGGSAAGGGAGGCGCGASDGLSLLAFALVALRRARSSRRPSATH